MCGVEQELCAFQQDKRKLTEIIDSHNVPAWKMARTMAHVRRAGCLFIPILQCN